MKRVLIIAMMLIVGNGSLSHATPVQWSVGAVGNGHYYEVVAVIERLTWTQARDAAVARGGYLATITSAEENDFVFDVAKSVDDAWCDIPSINMSLGPWIGGSKESPEPDGSWTWVSGEPWSYTNWIPGQPSIANENYLHLAGMDVKRASTWNDVESPMWGYVVEWDVVPEPSCLLGLSCGVAGLGTVIWRRK